MSYTPQQTSVPARFRIVGGLIERAYMDDNTTLIMAKQVKATISSVGFVDPQFVSLIEYLNASNHKDTLLELEIAEDGTIVGRVVGP